MELAPSTLLGLCLTMAGILLYLMRIKKKDLSRDYDLFFSSVGCLCGGILIFQGWRLDPILLLCQMMSSGTAIFFIAETVWLRNIDIERRQINLDTYQNMSDKKKIFLSQKKSLIEKNVNAKNSRRIGNNQYFLKNIDYLVQIDYTLPIDYY
jgi:hypothetical protein